MDNNSKKNNAGDTTPQVEYFASDAGNSIPCFDVDAIRPFTNKLREEFEDWELDYGSIVKVYDYRVTKSASEIRWHRPFFENLTDTVLPFRFLDFRITPDKNRDANRKFGVDARTFCGLETAAAEYTTDEFDAYFDEGFKSSDRLIPIGAIDHPDLGKITIRCILLKEDPPEWLRETEDRIFHSVNGQVHFKQKKG